MPLPPPGRKLCLIRRSQVAQLESSRQQVFQLLPRARRQRCAANIGQRQPPQMSPRLSACLDLVPCMKGCEFFDLIHEFVQPLPVLTLKGVQFGQTGLRLYSCPVWCPRRGCSPVVVFVDWRLSAQVHWPHHDAPILRHVRVSSVQVQWPSSYFRSSWWFYIDSLLGS